MMTLTDPDLGVLAMRSDPFVVVSFQIGSPLDRPVGRNRALADGVYDDSRYGGQRAVTVGLTLNTRSCAGAMTSQEMFDVLLPFMHPRRRPTLAWSLPGSNEVRQMVVRGVSAPVTVVGAKYPTVVLSFVSAGEIVSPEVECLTLDPSTLIEAGRTYDLTFPRVYPPSGPAGEVQLMQGGNELAHWRATIYGAVTDPFLVLNGVPVEFDENGGLDLTAGQSVVIDTRERTILLNGDPTEPRFHVVNFAEWQWDDLMLRPGINLVRFGADVVGAAGIAEICWSRTWAG